MVVVCGLPCDWLPACINWAKNFDASGVDALDNSFPLRGLSGIRDAGLEEVTLAGLVIDVETFGDQQTEPTVGENPVIGADPIGGNARGRRAHSGHRCQGDAIS